MPGVFEKAHKIVGVITEDEIVVAVDAMGLYATDGVFLFGTKTDVDPHFVAAILNSALYTIIYSLFSPERGRVFAQVKPTVLEGLPMPTVEDSSVRSDLTETITSVAKALASGLSDPDPTLKQKLDDSVCALFGLSDEERNYIYESFRAFHATGSS
jgi:hypothetical protein